jgi:peptide deformylase
MIRDILRMGDPRFSSARARSSASARRTCEELLADMRDTMREADGAGLAAPQIGVPLRVVIFSVEANPRYPDAEPCLTPSS